MTNINPATIPQTKEQIQEFQDNPSLVRDYILNLPDGYSLYFFCKVVMGYDDMVPHVHGLLCEFLEHPRYGRFRDATVPRSFFKTSIATIAKSIWLPLRHDRNIRILIAMNTADNAQKRVFTIKRHWEKNELLKQAFPECVPDFKHTRWSNSCADINRIRNTEEGTYEAIGAGGAVISRHYDHIVEDDLVYAKKDDLTGGEIQPNQEDIEKAIGWHKLARSLFAHPEESTLDSIGTRWAPHDIKDWIYKNEKNKFKFFQINAETQDNKGNYTGVPVWPERFSKNALKEIRDTQGPYMYYTQYLNCPRDPADALFDINWLQYYDNTQQIPKPYQTATFVDLALWGDTKGRARNVILTLARDYSNNIWILRYDRGKFNPTEVIDTIKIHNKLYDSSVHVEEIYYQKSIRHFAKKDMEETGNFYTIKQLRKSTGKNAKDIRIKTIQPVAFNGAIHVKHSMKELINEFADYPSGLTCDILDCIGYATQYRIPTKPEEPKKESFNSPFELTEILDDIKKTHRHTNKRYTFNNQLSLLN